MRESLAQWTSRIQAEHPKADIQVIKQYGGVVGCFAWGDEKHNGGWPVSRWPDYLIPGYTMLSAVPDDPCDNWEPSWYRGHAPLLAGVER